MKTMQLMLAAGISLFLPSGCGDDTARDNDGAGLDIVDLLADVNDGGGDDASDRGVDDSGNAPEERNACGGLAVLAESPGDACGSCHDGVLICDGADALRCHGAQLERNPCGTCEVLPGNPGDACGCAGTLVCDGASLLCAEATERNGCGGCAALESDAELGHLCDDGGGIVVCTGPNDVACRGEDANVCGGAGALALERPELEGRRPGDACGACGLGVVACNGPDLLGCLDADRGVNACGGCVPLRGQPDAACGCGGSGRWVCDDSAPGGVRCEGADAPNACGGCAELDAAPGEPCESGTVGCTGPDTTVCVREPEAAPCGADAFDGAVGGGCGECGDGVEVCAATDRTVCVGASARNVCGGCGLLAGEPGSPCGGGSAWQCADDGTVSCVRVESRNVCGGVSPLSRVPGEPCGACGDGLVVCISDEDVACLGEGISNACGGCGQLAGVPGRPCGVCNTGRWACDGNEDVVCAGEDPDAEFLQFRDADEDGFGSNDEPVLLCPGTPLYARRTGDCDDARADVNPDAPELCDGRDNDCDDEEDEDFIRFRDADGDGFGDPEAAVVVCAEDASFVANDRDCDDEDRDVRPNQQRFFSTPSRNDSWDYDCDGEIEVSVPETGECGIPPLGCNLTVTGQRDGWLAEPIPGCGESELYLFDCLPNDDGCEPQVSDAVIQGCR